MSSLLDVVAVPDFRAGSAAMFEARTLFFLASWLERAGERARREFHLGLACIGEPPASVRNLARQCAAEISIHEPLTLNKGLTTNKLRGFEAPAHSDRLLLLDSDTLVLGDLGDLINALPASAIAAAPAGNARIPEADWERIYDALELPRPVERMLSIRGELGLREPIPMYPYYNSGVLLLPRSTNLATLWAHDIATIAALQNASLALTASDQAGLATAMHRLRLAGAPFQRLPQEYHALPPHFTGGALGFNEARLFHAVGFLRGVKSQDEVLPATETYIKNWAGRTGEEASSFLRNLWARYVHEALQS